MSGDPAPGKSTSPAPAGLVRAHAIVSGLVQGVCFRAETRYQAERIGVAGWVRNLPDGSVELVAEGSRPLVDRLLAWCRHGPAYARVDHVDVTWEEPTGELKGFGISR